MKRLLTNLAFIFVCSTALIAQADFRKGYIVKLNGDTLTGFVNFQKEAVNISSCNFKRFEVAFPVTYSPEKLKAYGFDGGKQYLSAIINGKAYFIEYLVKGEVSLLYLNRGGTHFFIQSGNEKLVELRSGKTTDLNNGQVYESYKDFLKRKLQPGDFASAIQDSKLEMKSMVSLISQYNEQSKFKYLVPERPKEKSMIADYNLLGTNKVPIGVMGGVSLFKLAPTITEKGYFPLTQSEYKWNSSATAGIFIRKEISKLRPQWSAQTNILYQEVSLYGFGKNAKSLNKDVIYFDDIYFDYQAVKFQLLLNYSLLESKIKIVPHLGVGYNHRLNPQYRRFNEEYNTASSVVKSFEYKEYEVKDKEYVLIGGVTFDYKISKARSVFLELDYEYGSKIIEVEKDSNLYNIGFKNNYIPISLVFGITL